MYTRQGWLGVRPSSAVTNNLPENNIAAKTSTSDLLALHACSFDDIVSASFISDINPAETLGLYYLVITQ